jgi:hypothetical protein
VIVVLAWSTVKRAWHDRVLGLAAEAGFWQLLSLPSLILAVLGTIGYFSGVLGHDNVTDLQRTIDNGLGHVIVQSAVQSTVAPALHRILFGGRADVVSFAFLVSLWTGSSAMATYVNTITIAYGMRGRRSAVASRLLALRLYLGFVLATIILLPLLVLGPGKLVGLFPQRDYGLIHRHCGVLAGGRRGQPDAARHALPPGGAGSGAVAAGAARCRRCHGDLAGRLGRAPRVAHLGVSSYRYLRSAVGSRRRAVVPVPHCVGHPVRGRAEQRDRTDVPERADPGAASGR